MQYKLMTILCCLFLFINSQAQEKETYWVVEPSHAKVGFSITHFGISETEGRFQKYTGKIYAEKEDFSDAQINLSIDVSSIDTDNDDRDAHLLAEDFFNAEKYPTIEFKSTKMEALGDNKYKLHGDFTMMGVSKSIELDVVYKGTIKDFWGNTRAGFNIDGVINRMDYGLTWNSLLDTGGLALGEEVTLNCNVELIQKTEGEEEEEKAEEDTEEKAAETEEAGENR